MVLSTEVLQSSSPPFSRAAAPLSWRLSEEALAFFSVSEGLLEAGDLHYFEPANVSHGDMSYGDKWWFVFEVMQYSCVPYPCGRA